MKLIANRQLYGDYGLKQGGETFDCPDDVASDLIRRGLARKAEPPAILYETKIIEAAPEVSPAFPFVSCACLTKNRRTWLKRAIENYFNQKYYPMELLIVADGDDVREYIPFHPRIRLIQISEGYTIGQKRNFANAHARGSVIAHWDDDDWSAPNRLMDQVRRLVESGKAVTGYNSLLFENESGQRWRWNGKKPSYAAGTSLVYRKSFWEKHNFPCIQVAEDEAFCRDAWDEQQIVTAHGEDFMIASIHAGNTSPRNLSNSSYEPLEALC